MPPLCCPRPRPPQLDFDGMDGGDADGGDGGDDDFEAQMAALEEGL